MWGSRGRGPPNALAQLPAAGRRARAPRLCDAADGRATRMLRAAGLLQRFVNYSDPFGLKCVVQRTGQDCPGGVPSWLNKTAELATTALRNVDAAVGEYGDCLALRRGGACAALALVGGLQGGAAGGIVRGRAPEFLRGTLKESEFLSAVGKYLGNGYKEASSGRFLSADGARQVRFGAHEVRGSQLHGHFEAVENGRVVENARVNIRPDQ